MCRDIFCLTKLVRAPPNVLGRLEWLVRNGGTAVTSSRQVLRAPTAKLDLLSLDLMEGFGSFGTFGSSLTTARIPGKQPQIRVRPSGWPRHFRQTSLVFLTRLFLIWDLLGRPKHLFMDTKDNDSWLKFLATEVFYVETMLFSFSKTKFLARIFLYFWHLERQLGPFGIIYL